MPARQHEDAVLLSPGHALYGASIEKMRELLRAADGGRRSVRGAMGSGAVRDPLLHLRHPGHGPARPARSRRGRSSSPWSRTPTVPQLVLARRPARPHRRSTTCHARSRHPTPRRLRRATNHRALRRAERQAPRGQRGACRAGRACARTTCARPWTPSATRCSKRYALLDERVYRGEDAARFARDRAEVALEELRAPARVEARRVRAARRRPPRHRQPRRHRARRPARAARGA